MPIEPDISQLIARAKAGDDTAIREFLNRFEPEVRMMVRRPAAEKPTNQV